MSYKLIKTSIAGSIERVRGETKITVPVVCEFMTKGGSLQMVGVANCLNATDIPQAIIEAIDNAKENMSKVFQEQPPSDSVANEKLGDLMKLTLQSAVASELKKSATSKDEYDKMMDLANEEKQAQVSQLCEALGIDKVLVVGKYTNVEALVLISYLEKMTEPLARGA